MAAAQIEMAKDTKQLLPPPVSPNQTVVPGSRREPEINPALGVAIVAKNAAASNYSTRSTHRRRVLCIVLHCAHEALPPPAALAAARYARKRSPAVSMHYVLDQNAVFRCVADKNIALHCGRTGDARALGILLCAAVAQRRSEWLADRSMRILELAAWLVAMKCREYDLPVRFLNAAALRAGATGITTHREVSHAWRESSYGDPGERFPMDLFIDAVAVAHSSI